MMTSCRAEFKIKDWPVASSDKPGDLRYEAVDANQEATARYTRSQAATILPATILPATILPATILAARILPATILAARILPECLHRHA